MDEKSLLLAAYEQQRKDIEEAFIKTEMTEKERAQLVAHAELEYRKAQIEKGFLDYLFEEIVVNEAEKVKTLSFINNDIETTPKPKANSFGLIEAREKLVINKPT